MRESLEEMFQSAPFQPFQIVLTSGDRYDVLNPRLVTPMRSQVFYAYPRSDHWALLRLNQIASLEVIRRAA